MNFNEIGAQNVEIIEGSITLKIAGFVSLSGDFGFEEFTDPSTNATEILAGGDQISSTLGTSTTNLSISDASFGLLIVPGTGGGTTTYALVANGGADSLNGVPDVSLTTTGLTVQVISANELAAFNNANAQVPRPTAASSWISAALAALLAR